VESIASSPAYIEFEQKHARHINMLQENVICFIMLGPQLAQTGPSRIQQNRVK
jgi:hypothetical protein